MSAPIPLRDYVVSGQVRAETVEALMRHGQPMVSDFRDMDSGDEPDPYPYRAFLRRGVGQGMRTMGPSAGSVQSAADGLLEKLRTGRP